MTLSQSPYLFTAADNLLNFCRRFDWSTLSVVKLDSNMDAESRRLGPLSVRILRCFLSYGVRPSEKDTQKIEDMMKQHWKLARYPFLSSFQPLVILPRCPFFSSPLFLATSLICLSFLLHLLSYPLCLSLYFSLSPFLSNFHSLQALHLRFQRWFPPSRRRRSSAGERRVERVSIG